MSKLHQESGIISRNRGNREKNKSLLTISTMFCRIDQEIHETEQLVYKTIRRTWHLVKGHRDITKGRHI